MNQERFSYIKRLYTASSGFSNADFITEIPSNNKLSVKNLGEDKLRTMIYRYIDEEGVNLKKIEEMLEIVRRATGEELNEELSIVRLFYEILTRKILLPEVQKNFNEEGVYQEIKEIIDRTKNNFLKKIERQQSGGFFSISVPRLDRVREEFAIFGNIDSRSYHLGGIFGFVTLSNEPDKEMRFDIPIRVNSIKEKTSLTKGEVYDILSEFFEQRKWKYNEDDIIMEVKEIVDANKDYDNFTHQEYILVSIKTSPVNDFLMDNDMREVIDKNLLLATDLINFLAEKSKIKHNNRHIVFSNTYADAVWGECWFADELFVGSNNIGADDDDDDFDGQVKSGFWAKRSSLDKFSVDMIGEYSLESVGWNQEAKIEVEKVIKSIKFADIMKSWGARPTSGMIFEWPPGTGKTLFAKVIAAEVDAQVYNIKLTDIASSAYINEGANNVAKMFEEIRKKAKKWEKMVVIFDEVDALLSKRWEYGDKEDTKIVNTFLTEMDGFSSLENVIFIGTTNHIDVLDPAIVRPGRMGMKISIKLPDAEGLKQIYAIHLGKISARSEKFAKISKDLDLEKIVKLSEWISGADVEEVIRIIVENKAMEEIDGNQNISLTEEDFEKALKKIKRTERVRWIGFTAS